MEFENVGNTKFFFILLNVTNYEVMTKEQE